MTSPQDVRTKLVESFESVFYGLDETQIRAASVESLDSWDSLAAISLVAVIEEDFDLELPEDEIKTMTSFDAAADVLVRLVGSQA